MLMRKIALQHYIQQLRQRHRPPVDQKLEQVTKLSHAGASIKKSRTWSLTNKKVADLVRDLSATWSQTSRRQVFDK